MFVVLNLCATAYLLKIKMESGSEEAAFHIGFF
jgi:hypothetical protein